MAKTEFGNKITLLDKDVHLSIFQYRVLVVLLTLIPGFPILVSHNEAHSFIHRVKIFQEIVQWAFYF